MKLPNHSRAIVAEAKIVKYLLNEAHPRGKDKAAFFGRFGFSVGEWEILKTALLAHANSFEVMSILESTERTYYAIEGDLTTPDGRNPRVRSVWAVDRGSETPRLITAYPVKSRGIEK
jgi:hypothetical protein